MSAMYPMVLRLDGRRVLMVGGGAVATRRVPALLEARALVTMVSPEITPALLALVEAGRIEWHRRAFAPDDVEGAWLVHVAVDDPEAAAAVTAAADRHRVFCVRADDRAEATAWTPAVARHGSTTVAVCDAGPARRAATIRDAIRDGMVEGSLLPSVDAAVPRGVALIGAGPGDPELITVRGRRLLSAAQVVIVDHLALGVLVEDLRPDVELIDASKLPYGPSRSQDEINRLIVDRAKQGRFVVRLKGGDPFVFGRGGEEALACAAAGVEVTVVPGVSSAISVPSAAGIPVTHRGVAHEFTVVSGHLPPGHAKSLVDWAALGRLRGTVCVLMGLKNLAAIAEALIAGGRSEQTPVAVVQEGTTSVQRSLVATLAGIAEAVASAGIRPPAVVVIGPVVGVLEPTVEYLRP